MARGGDAVHIVTATRHDKGKVYQSRLLRSSFREDGKIDSETVGDLSHLPDHVVDLMRPALQDGSFVPA